jgi:hypothetical protein
MCLPGQNNEAKRVSTLMVVATIVIVAKIVVVEFGKRWATSQLRIVYDRNGTIETARSKRHDRNGTIETARSKQHERNGMSETATVAFLANFGRSERHGRNGDGCRFGKLRATSVANTHDFSTVV